MVQILNMLVSLILIKLNNHNGKNVVLIDIGDIVLSEIMDHHIIMAMNGFIMIDIIIGFIMIEYKNLILIYFILFYS